MSNTYRIIGADQDKRFLSLNNNVIEDNDSFYGSDKETDDVLMFSEDEGQHDKFEDSSSSDEEQTIKVNGYNY